jgi:hypothetical protein
MLANGPGLDDASVHRRFDGLLEAQTQVRHVAFRSVLTTAFAHFRKATRSYRPHLFACRDVADLPRTNNDLEQSFGLYRYHKQRCSGRKVANSATVVRGSVRMVAAMATRAKAVGPANLVPTDLAAWRGLRTLLEPRRTSRTLGHRFRRGPEA